MSRPALTGKQGSGSIFRPDHRKQRHESPFNVGYLTVRCIDPSSLCLHDQYILMWCNNTAYHFSIYRIKVKRIKEMKFHRIIFV